MLLAMELAITLSTRITFCLRLTAVSLATSRAYLLSRELAQHACLLNTRLEFSTVIVSSEQTVFRKVRSAWRLRARVPMTPVTDDETRLFIVR
jgi:hypothetical protein